MIFYILVNADKFRVGICNDLKEVINANDDLESSIYFEGDEEDLTDLLNNISIVFKKLLVDENIFSTEHFMTIMNFIESQKDDNIIKLSEAKKIELNKNNTKTIFYFLVYSDRNKIEIGLTDSHSKININNLQFAKNDSIIFKYEKAENIFDSFRLELPFIEINEDKIEITDKRILDYAINIMKYKLLIISNISTIQIFTDNTVFDFGTSKTKLTSNEVCTILNISKQLLSKWRKSGKIQYSQISPRHIFYDKSEVDRLIDLEISKNELHTIENIPKQIKKSKKVLPTRVSRKNYIEEIKDWMRTYSYKIYEGKYSRQYFFLNFGTLLPKTSPQVMIDNEGRLVDYIKGNILCNTTKETFEFLQSLDRENKKPTIDKSTNTYSGFDKMYLNNLYIPTTH